jgi:murein DD-endopeptidase MepM/ murein hydrolase activator NlpD
MASLVALSRSCSRLAALTLIVLGAAGCSSETARFTGSALSNPYASNQTAPASSDVTGSIRSPQTTKIESQPLPHVGHATGPLPPPPGRPATVASGVAGGGTGMSSYQPAAASPDITGSVASAQPARGWDWDGGTAVTVAQGDTIDSISRRYGVPAAAIMQANALTSPNGIRPGQRLVIPRYNAGAATASAPAARAPMNVPVRAAPSMTASAGTHVVAPGETLIKIAHRYRVPLMEIAKANRIEPYKQIRMGDRLIIPGRALTPAQSAAVRPEAGQMLAQPKSLPAPQQKMATVESPHTARVLTPVTETPDVESAPAKTADAAAPAFRWPVRGRIIAGFGPKTNGQQNDGINLAVPEGTPVKAAEDGVVAYAGNELKGYGNLVLVRHPNGFVTAYAHTSELLVKRGDPIKRGQVIARSGQTGTVTSPQLHFEIRKGSAPVDPTQYLTGA